MAKNIILCADGTGNKGGYTPDSNVYKMYKAIEIHDKSVSQYTFYDNGVGTSTNKYWRAFTGAIGIGIKHNVMDLYRFLSLNYVPGDKVFLFGFSRGAATIRGFCGFINAVGLVNGKPLSDEQLKDYTCDAFEAYESHRKDPQRAERFRTHRHSHGIIDIHFVGVWDTVSALGFPKRTDRMGITLNILSVVFWCLERLSNLVWPHLFYNYELSKNIKHAYQALAIDDERTAFWPKVWDEVKAGRTPQDVEQVWFSGMHSNVGGGYERQGMANVTMHWMMLRAQQQGLKFKPGFVEGVYQDSNIHGRLYNSRDGFAIYYRYHPRIITRLCEGRLLGNIKVHESTCERLKKRTANYAPFVLPSKCDIVGSDLDAKAKTIDLSEDDERNKQQKIINRGINIRKWLYGGLADLTAFVVAYVVYYSIYDEDDNVSLWSLIMKSITTGDYVSLGKNLIEYHLHAVLLVTLLLLFMWLIRKSAIARMKDAAEDIRSLVVSKLS
ncbi:MAG: DUF2235 domain-containing protein [Gammaproteobacteria bacterium]|nr:DUF2235 domain-containing protein [Gammaproteobacteria bacterium]